MPIDAEAVAGFACYSESHAVAGLFDCILTQQNDNSCSDYPSRYAT